MEKIGKGTMISKIAAFLICATVSSMLTIQIAFSSTDPRTGQNFFINGTKDEGVAIYKGNGYIFIPGADVAKAMGDEVSGTSGNLIIKHGDKTISFTIGESVYTVNGEIKNISVKDVNGVKIPESSMVRGWNNKLYVPMEILESELGYNISEDDNNVWVGNEPNNLPQTHINEYSHSNSNVLPALPPNTTRVQWTTTPITENMQKQYAEWVCPQLKSTSVDDVGRDATTLIKELEFVENGYTSAKFDPIGYEATYITAAVGPTSSYEFSSIYFNGYYIKAKNNGYMDKINKINPQILKFYFPNSWEWIHNQFMSGNSLNEQRFTIDGRDTYFSVGNGKINISFSKVGGNLEKPYIPTNSSRTIGTAPIIDKGFWGQDGDKWYYKNSDGSYVTGWLQDGGYKYYFDDKGVMKTGWVYYSGFWHYMWSNGQMAVDTVVNGYKIDKDGTWENY